MTKELFQSHLLNLWKVWNSIVTNKRTTLRLLLTLINIFHLKEKEEEREEAKQMNGKNSRTRFSHIIYHLKI